MEERTQDGTLASVYDVFSKNRRQLAHRARPDLSASRSGERQSVAESQVLTAAPRVSIGGSYAAAARSSSAMLTNGLPFAMRLPVRPLQKIVRHSQYGRVCAEAIRERVPVPFAFSDLTRCRR